MALEQAKAYAGRAASAAVAVAEEAGALAKEVVQSAPAEAEVGDYWRLLDAGLRRRVGDVAVDRGTLGLQILVTLCIARGVWLLISLFRGTDRGTRHHATKAHKSKEHHKEDKGGKKGKHADKPAAPTPPVAPAAAPAAVAPTVPQSLRKRAPTVSAPLPWRGFPMVGVLASSPCGNYVLASCREKRVVRYYPQHPEFARTIKGTENKTTLTEVPSDAVITRVIFAADGRTFALADVVNEALYIYGSATDLSSAVHGPHKPSGIVTFKRTWRPEKPKKGSGAKKLQLFDPHKYASLVLAENGDCLLAFDDKTAGLEVIDTSGGTGGPIGTRQTLRAGGSCVWAAAAGGRIVGSGSFINHLRVFDLHIRGHDRTELAPVATITNSVRLTHLALTPDGKRALCRSAASAAIQVWDLAVSYRDGEAPKLLATFEDADFGEADSMHVAYAHKCNTSTRTDMQVAFVRGGDFVVHHLPNCGPDARGAADKPPRRVLEVHDAHDGMPIKHFAFAGRFTAVATAAEEDELLRLWPCEPAE